MKKDTIIKTIYDYLRRKPEGEWGGRIEDYVRNATGAKGDTTARRLREMVERESIICIKAVPPNGKRPVNYYRVKPMPVFEKVVIDGELRMRKVESMPVQASITL
jgi:hypothetical protein